MATRPARQPLSVMPISGLPSKSQQVSVAVSVAAAAAMLVVTAISAMATGSTPIVLPGLNPNQPNHRIKQPIVAAVMLWPGMALTLPSAPYLPMRGPRMMMPARAAQPPIEWTCVRAGEIDEAAWPQPAAAPNPVADHGIDADGHDEAEHDERAGT